MLYLSPPIYVIDGVTLYPDHQDPLQWYALPLSPVATSMQLVKFVSESADGNFDGGLLDFDVHLPLDLEGLKPKLAAALQEEAKKKGTTFAGAPRVAALKPSDGTVKVMMLGMSAGAGDADPKSAKMIINKAFPSSPSLYGDEAAIFSVMLDPAGAQIVEASLIGKAGTQTAVGVIYELTFDALRPTYAISAVVDWAKVHDSLLDSYKLDGVFAGVDISNTVDTMDEKKGIKLVVDRLADDDKPSAIEGMLGQVKTMIFDNFFEPAPEPPPPDKPDGWDKAGNLMNEAAQLAVTGGLSALGHFTWTHKTVHESFTKQMTIDLSERSVTKMKICPQAHLFTMVDALGTGSALVKEVQIGKDPFYKRRNLQLDVNVDFTVEGIHSVEVNMNYDGDVQERVFKLQPTADGSTPALAPVPQASWESAIVAGQMKRDVEVSYFVNFNDGRRLASKAIIVQGDYWTISPRELYAVNSVIFTASGAADFWDRYRAVEVKVRYSDAKNKLQINQTLPPLDAKAMGGPLNGIKWTRFQLDPDLNTFDYKLAFQQVAGKSVETDWQTTDAPYVDVPDPQPDKLSLKLVPPAPWPDTLDNIQVDLVYDPGGTADSKSVSFDSDSAAPQTVTFRLAGKVAKFVRVDVRFEMTDLDAPPVIIPSFVTDEQRLRLSPKMKPRNVNLVVVRPQAVPFAGKKLDHIELRIQGAEDGSSAPQPLLFSSPDDVRQYRYYYSTIGGFKYQPVYYYAGYTDDASKKYTGIWVQSPDTDSLLIPVIAEPA